MEGTNAYGCTAQAELTHSISVRSLPRPTWVEPHVCSGDNLTITINSADGGEITKIDWQDGTTPTGNSRSFTDVTADKT